MLTATIRTGVILGLIACAPISSRAAEQSAKPDEQRKGSEFVVPAPPAHDPVATPPEAPRADSKPKNWHEWFWPPIWSNWALVIVAGLTAWAAFRTLREIQTEVIATRRAAKAATRSAKVADQSLRLLNRPWLDTMAWGAGRIVDTQESDGQGGWILHVGGVRITFKIINNSNTPARIHWIRTIVIFDDGEELTVDRVIDTVITPGSDYAYQVDQRLSEDRVRQFQTDGLILTVRGAIHYADLFSPRQPPSDTHQVGPRIRRFGRLCVLNDDKGHRFDIPAGAEGVGLNDEDWDAEQS